MKYSHLACLLVGLMASFGRVREDHLTDFQEDCAGKALLSSGVSLWGLRCQRRDASRLKSKVVYTAQCLQ